MEKREVDNVKNKNPMVKNMEKAEFIKKTNAAAEIIAAVQIHTMPNCVVCDGKPQRLFNIVSSEGGLTGFSVCRECMDKPLLEILNSVAMSTYGQTYGN